MPIGSSGTYTARGRVRLPSDVVMRICGACNISENSSVLASTHCSPEAFGSHNCDFPPRTGTVHVSYGTVNAIVAPSGLNTGSCFSCVGSCVSCSIGPFGSIITYTSPGPLTVRGPRKKVSMRPSGDSEGN